MVEMSLNFKYLIRCKSVISYIRKIAGVPKNIKQAPIIIIKGNSKPKFLGSSYCFKTKGGSPIYHPASYQKSGWSNMVYHPASHRIEVGEKWLKSKKWDKEINSIDYLSQALFPLGYYMSYDSSYYIFRFTPTLYILYDNCSLKEIKIIANKLIKLKVFS